MKSILNILFTTYIIYNINKDKIYIGYTSDLEKRLLRHNGFLKNKKSSYTFKNKGLWKLIYFEKYNSRQEAFKREKWLKTGIGRDFIKNNLNDWLKKSQLADPPQADF